MNEMGESDLTIDTTVFLLLDTHPYLFFALIGIVVSLFVYILLIFFSRLDTLKYLKRLVVSALFLAIGAKVFGILWNVLSVLRSGQPLNADVFIFSGIVFYGGMIGLVASFLFLMRNDDAVSKRRARNSLAVVIPLFHTFGRLGCFFAGCCYGKESEGLLTVTYTNYINGVVVTADRVPIQLIEAVFNLLLSAVLFVVCVTLKEKCDGLSLYLLAYSTARFVFEYFRGDWEFYSFQFVSYSQLVSVLLIVAVVIEKIYQKMKGLNEDG